MLLTTPDGRVLAANEAACRMFGRSEEELARLGRTYVVDSSDSRLAPALEQRARTGRYHGELTFVRKDGGKFSGEVSSAIFTDRRGEMRTSMVIRDVTERHRAEAALAESEQRYRKLAHQSPYSIFIHQDGKLIFANPAGCRLLGAAEVGQLIGLPMLDLIHPDYRKLVVARVQDAFASGKMQPVVEVVLVRLDHSNITVEASAAVMVHQGRPAMQVLVHDITKRKRVETELRESEERLRLAAQAAGFGTFTYDFVSGASNWSSELMTLSGVPPGKPLLLDEAGLFTGIHPDDRSAFLAAMTAACHPGGNGMFRHDYRVIHPDGAVRWLLVRGQISFAGEGEARRAHRVAGVVLDITERKRAETELQTSRDQLRALARRLQTVREEERTRAAREIHDVLAQELTRLKIDLVWLHGRLAKTGKRAGADGLAARVVEMSRLADTAIHCVQKIATDLRPAVLDSLGLCAAVEWQAQDFQARAGIQCHASVPEEEPPVSRDAATAAFRILQESLTNVLRHAHATQVDVSLRQETGQLILRIDDNGAGMKADTFSNPRSIGLAGMQERALLFGGQLEIRSQPGSGTTVEMWIPLSKIGDSPVRQP